MGKNALPEKWAITNGGRESVGYDSSLEEVDDESSMFGKWAMTFRELGKMWAMGI